MKQSKLKLLMSLCLLALTVIVCSSPANHARQTVNEVCASLDSPNSSISSGKDVMVFRSVQYVLAERYVASQSQLKQMSGCITALKCALDWADWQHSCDRQRSFFKEFIFGRSSCDLGKPSC